MLSVNNSDGFKNSNGYQYANTEDVNGSFSQRALRALQISYFLWGSFGHSVIEVQIIGWTPCSFRMDVSYGIINGTILKF
jgi:hypothetical protein